MPDVRVINKVQHSGLQFFADEIIGNLSDKEARQLVDAGEASLDTEGKAPSAGHPIGTQHSQLKEDLLSAKPAKVARTAKSRAAKAKTGKVVGDTAQPTVTEFTYKGDTYKRSVSATGRTQYRKNGQIAGTSRADFEKFAAKAKVEI